MKRLEDAIPELQELIEETATRLLKQGILFFVVSVYRDEETQNEAYRRGRSGVKFPNSRHNKKPCPCADLCPWDVDKGEPAWSDRFGYYQIMITMLQVALEKQIPLRHWPLEFRDRNRNLVKDLPHVEIDVEKLEERRKETMSDEC